MVALSLMADKAIAGIGVVSQSGALIGNFSYSDLRSALMPLTTIRPVSAIMPWLEDIYKRNRRALGGGLIKKRAEA